MRKAHSIPVLRLKQWLTDWDEYEYDKSALRRKPEPYLFMFSMPANLLRRYSDVYQRERTVTEVEGIQRAQEVSRTDRIRRYIQYGYPFGDLNQNLQVDENLHLRKPGWLPTAIVVNILTTADRRRGKTIKTKCGAKVRNENGSFSLELPHANTFGKGDLRPFEVIDGQHRLWAFAQDGSIPEDFELPVVAFHGLDVAWQAYLFWSINISPKRINPSHAFDLYPLLRTQDWLQKTGEISVYREARAQEIAEWLYRYDDSPWHGRINMLGGKGEARVSQAAWVRSLIGSFFSTGRGRGRYGLFQVSLDEDGTILQWCRPQQIAFIVEFWLLLQDAVSVNRSPWRRLYSAAKKNAFSDKSTMLNQDMGVRAVHAVVNDLFYWNALDWALDEWQVDSSDETSTDEIDIELALESLREQEFHQHLRTLAKILAKFDWRSLDGPKVRSSEDELTKRAYRGSGGYSILVEHILTHVSIEGRGGISETASDIMELE